MTITREEKLAEFFDFEHQARKVGFCPHIVKVPLSFSQTVPPENLKLWFRDWNSGFKNINWERISFVPETESIFISPMKVWLASLTLTKNGLELSCQENKKNIV